MYVGEHEVGDGLADRGRRDVHDPPPPALPHAGDGALDQSHRRQHEAAVGGLPLVGREGKGVGAGRRAAGVGDQDLDRAELLLDGADEPRRALEVRAVVDQGMCSGHLPRGGIDALARARRHRHARALLGQRPRDPQADPLRGAGDQRRPALDTQLHRAAKSTTRRVHATATQMDRLSVRSLGS